jgi:hypothetical protein
MTTAINVVLSALVIGAAARLSGAFPRAAGFLVSLPLATMLVLPMAYLQGGDIDRTVAFATSILVAVPVVMLFVLAFVVAARFGMSFWTSYLLAAAWLLPGFYVHRYLAGLF